MDVLLLPDVGFDVSLRIDAAELQFVNTTDYGSDGLVFHSYNLSQPYKTVMVSVYPASANQTLNVYVQFEESPTLDEFDYHIVVRVIIFFVIIIRKSTKRRITISHEQQIQVCPETPSHRPNIKIMKSFRVLASE